jgi:ABC-type multidrug transport system fused ATPase/permease subunit
MEQGQLVEGGSHEELLERGELYINLRKLQVGLR